jgi:hypothetical protein
MDESLLFLSSLAKVTAAALLEATLAIHAM